MMLITKKHKTIVASIVIFVSVYAGVGFYLLPLIVSKKLPDILHEQTGHQASLESLKLNPFSFELELQNFSLTDAENKPLLSFDRFVVNFNAWESLRHLAVVFDSIELSKPYIHLIREANGQFNFSHLVAKSKPDQEPSTPVSIPPITLHQLSIDNGEFNWLDVSQDPQQGANLKPINLKIAELTTEINTKGHFDLGFELASGGHLQWQGEFTLSPLASTGLLQIEQLNLATLSKEFFAKLLPATLTQGNLNVHTDYQVESIANKLELKLSKAEIDLDNLKLSEKNRMTDLISIPKLAIRDISLDLDKKKIKAHSLISSAALFNLALEADGRLNYQRLFAIKPAPPTQASSIPTPPATNAESTWQIGLEELVIDKYHVQLRDFSRTTPQTMQLTDMHLKLLNFSSPQAEKLPLEFDALFNKTGKLSLTGNLALSPFSAALVLNLSNVKLQAFQDYLDDYLRLDLVDGSFNTQGTINISSAQNLQLLFNGVANLNNLVTRDKINGQDFLKWTNLSLENIQYDLSQQVFSLDRLFLDHPYIRITVQKDRTTNLKQILSSKTATPSAVANSAKSDIADATPSPNINISKIQFNAGSSDFSDYSLILPFVTEMDELNGEINGYSSNQNKPLALTLKGKVYHLAPVNINGRYQLKNGDSNITLKFDHMPLPLITPYMADFAGYKIEKGQMSLDLQYKVQNGDLNAQNKIFIDQLTLGDQVDNPHATSLPLNLAIALLKDADGKINLDFPITGSLNDPSFSVGSLIIDVISNLITKLVSAPFHALGSLLDDEQDYSLVKFQPGSAEISASEMEKLDQLSKALINKPGLSLEIKGKAYLALDWPVIRSAALRDILKQMKSGELRDTGQTIRSEYINLTDPEYQRLLEKFFKEVFPQETEYSLLGKPQVKTQTDADFYQLAEQKIEEKLPVETERLNDLAISRSNAISKYLLEKAGIDLSRQYILSPELNSDTSAEIVSTLSLNVAH
jgi:hypothetical protein